MFGMYCILKQMVLFINVPLMIYQAGSEKCAIEMGAWPDKETKVYVYSLHLL